jgi:ABC-type multidrug transport system ATPase subunit
MVSDRILVVHRGRIVGNGTVEELARQAAACVHTEFAVEASGAEALAAVQAIEQVSEAELAGMEEGVARLQVRSLPETPVVAELDGLAREKGWAIRTLAERPLSLEDTFIALTGRDASAEGR